MSKEMTISVLETDQQPLADGRSIYLKTWGDFACFTRPEMKVERVSYPVMTPSAARGILEAILYRPQFRWHVKRIAVRRPVRFISFRRNEVKSLLSTRKPAPLVVEEDRTQRNTLALRDVGYVIEADLALTPLANRPRRKPHVSDEDGGPDSVVKYLAMFQRRVGKGQCFAQPYLGCREFPAHFEMANEAAMRVPPSPEPDSDLGFMVYDVFDLDVRPDQKTGKVEAKPKITLFQAALRDGILVERGSTQLPDWSTVKAQLRGSR